MTSNATTTYTRIQTAIHLADVVLGAMTDILATLRIGSTRRFSNPETDPCVAISNWINEESLKCVALECHQPNGAVSPILEVPVAYTGTGEGDREYTSDRASLARYLAKLQTVPRETSYRLLCSFHRPSSDQPGWTSAYSVSTSGMQSYDFGRLAAGPHASAYLRYFKH